ncbi:MAG TPA: FTR1 family protein [Candidatus Acidoferrum sp.]|nr:FTR1 family protein [Candidatus Acidoferrum sp.]
MGATFVVTLREAFEAALLLGIVYTYLDKVGARDHYRYVTLGGVLGAVASVLFGVALSVLSGPLLDLGPDAIGIAVVFVAVVVLTWHGWWMRQHARSVKSDVQRRLEQAGPVHRVWVIGTIAFIGVFREGAETVLFLWGLMTQTNVTGWGGVTGGALGIATAAVLGWAIFRGGRHVSLPRFFAVTSVLLLLVAAGLFSTGVGKLEAFGLLPGSPILWDTSRLLGDRGGVGGFLAGLVGYRARPSALEALAYVGYLLVAGTLLFGRGTSRPSRVRGTGARAGVS